MLTFRIMADVNAEGQLVLTLPHEIVVMLPQEFPAGKGELVVTVGSAVGTDETQTTTALRVNDTEIGLAALPAGDRKPARIANLDAGGFGEDASELLVDFSAAAPAAAKAAPVSKPAPAAKPAPAPPRESVETAAPHRHEAAALAEPAPPPPEQMPVERETPRPERVAAQAKPPTPERPLSPADRRPAASTGTRTAPTLAPPTALQLNTVLGEYQLTRKLGEGRIGTSYVARQNRLNRNVALKVLSRELAGDADIVQRFVEESQTLARLDHRNILHCYEVGEAQGHHFLAMDLVDEGSLATWLKKQGKFSPGDSVYIILGCCHGLHHAHELKVIHGDIKPENIFITKGSGIKLADFGLANVHDDNLLATSAGKTALLYMAPEQARDADQLDRRSDLYALGCLLYMFLTGQAPFQGATLPEMVEAKESGDFTPASELNAEVPEKLDTIIGKLLAPNPAERYQSCAALILDLEASGVAHHALNFMRSGEAPPPPKPATSAPAPKALDMRDLKGVEGYWYVSSKRDGQAAVRKMTYAHLLSKIKKKTVDGETLVSRSRNGTYRPLSSYPEFEAKFKPTKKAAAADPEHVDHAAWLRQEMSKQQKIDRRQLLGGLLSRARGNWRWIGLGGGLVAAVLLYMVFFTRTFWRVRRTIHNWFWPPTKKE